MSESFIFTAGKVPPVWTDQASPSTPFSLNETTGTLGETMSEMYVSAMGDDTQYFSTLEESTLEDLHGLEKEDLMREDDATAAIDDNDTGEQQVIVFNIEGSDDLYGIQFARDEEGNLQKYQFKFRQTDQGTLEAMPETIELLPNDEAVPQAQQQLFLQSNETASNQSVSGTKEDIEQQTVDYRASGDVKTPEEEFRIFEEEHDSHELDGEGNETIKPVLLQFSGTNLDEEIKQEMFNQDSQSPFEEQYDQIVTNVPEVCFKSEEHEEIILNAPDYAQGLNDVITEENSNTGSEHQYAQVVLGTNIEKSDDPEEHFIEESDNEEYEIEEGMHVTAEKELVSNKFDNECEVIFPQRQSQKVGHSNILKQPSIENSPREIKKKKVLYYLMPHPEKENFNSVMINNLNTFKLNPRSVLKPQTLELKLVPQPIVRTPDSETLKRLDKLERRRSRSKEVMEAKLFNNFINKTTIPHVPVRQKRLPRKQEIKPVDNRREEEIIVEEVMISSNGFVESVDERLKGKDKLEIVSYINLDDSDDESATASGKSKENVIEIFSSDEEDVEQSGTSKRIRGRRDRKRDREDNSQEYSSQDESSPSKKSRTESSGNDSDGTKTDNTCPQCMKTFPSLYSLKTHIQHHNLENRMHPAATLKYKCEHCQLSFKNSVLLARHQCENKSKIPTVSKRVMKGMAALHIDKNTKTVENKNDCEQSKVKTTAREFPCDKCHMSFKNSILLIRHKCHVCSVCQTGFKDLVTLNMHKRKHMKETMARTTMDVHVSPKKQVTGNVSDEKMKLRSTSTQVLKKFSCKYCTSKFTSRLLLYAHVSRNCVKSPAKGTGNTNAAQVPNKECSECSKTFKTYSDLHKHKLEHPNHSVSVAMNRATVTSDRRQLRSCTTVSGVTKK